MFMPPVLEGGHECLGTRVCTCESPGTGLKSVFVHFTKDSRSYDEDHKLSSPPLGSLESLGHYHTKVHTLHLLPNLTEVFACKLCMRKCVCGGGGGGGGGVGGDYS